MVDLSWIDEFINTLPEATEYKKSIFDIAGFPHWENVNSNVLAFFLDNNEDHNLQTLFIESLIAILDIKDDFVYGEYNVERESITNESNRVDIVVKGITNEVDEEDEQSELSANKQIDWVLIIENKVNSGLQNNLNDYWESYDAKLKIGIVLTKYKIDLTKHNVDGVYYQNITHKELASSVKNNLSEYFLNANERYLIFLKEYFQLIENYYEYEEMKQENIELLQHFQEYNVQINKLKKIDKRLLEYICKAFFKVFKENGFKPNSKAISKSKHFHPIDEKLKGLRCFVNMSRVKDKKQLHLFFEIGGRSNTKHSKAVKKYLTDLDLYTNFVKEGGAGGEKNEFCHLYFISATIDIDGSRSFEDVLRETLEQNFFKHKNNFIQEAVNALNQAKNEKI